MKKRILLIMAIGVTFTPAVFASTGPLGDRVEWRTGQMEHEKLQSRTGASGCNLGAKPATDADGFESTSGKSTAAPAKR